MKVLSLKLYDKYCLANRLKADNSTWYRNTTAPAQDMVGRESSVFADRDPELKSTGDFDKNSFSTEDFYFKPNSLYSSIGQTFGNSMEEALAISETTSNSSCTLAGSTSGEQTYTDLSPSYHMSTQKNDSGLYRGVGSDAVTAPYPTSEAILLRLPRSTNRRTRKLARRKNGPKSGEQSNSALMNMADADSTFFLANESKTMRLDLLRSLMHKTNQSIGDEVLSTVYRTGDKVISDTIYVLNHWNEWWQSELQQDTLSFPGCHGLSSAEICATMLQIVRNRDIVPSQSVPRRLARVLLHVFAAEFIRELEEKERHGEIFYRGGRTMTCIAHSFILDMITMDGWKYNRSHISDGKSLGKRWWKLGSGIGYIAILACVPGGEAARFM
jgi:hypothetical protein